MKELIIDGRSLGNCISYRSRDKYSDTTGDNFGTWVFQMISIHAPRVGRDVPTLDFLT